MSRFLEPVTALEHLHPGDLVLHDKRGLAKFEGTRSLVQDGKEFVVLQLRFAEEVLLYVPESDLSRMEKYNGKLNPAPHLDAIGLKSVAITRTRLSIYQDETSAFAPKRVRKAVRESVRHEVWRRDEGKCVRCGSRERLEFDHIVPFHQGGSDTARNIELLCEACNRAKGGRI